MSGVQVSFFHYPYSMIHPYVEEPLEKPLYMASVWDIAAMKANAIGSRGAKKDFFDLYQIYQKTDLTTEHLIDCLYKKYGLSYDFSYIGMGMAYFADAENEPSPETCIPYDWESIKRFFLEKSKEFETCISSKI